MALDYIQGFTRRSDGGVFVVFKYGSQFAIPRRNLEDLIVFLQGDESASTSALRRARAYVPIRKLSEEVLRNELDRRATLRAALAGMQETE